MLPAIRLNLSSPELVWTTKASSTAESKVTLWYLTSKARLSVLATEPGLYHTLLGQYGVLAVNLFEKPPPLVSNCRPLSSILMECISTRLGLQKTCAEDALSSAMNTD